MSTNLLLIMVTSSQRDVWWLKWQQQLTADELELIENYEHFLWNSFLSILIMCRIFRLFLLVSSSFSVKIFKHSMRYLFTFRSISCLFVVNAEKITMFLAPWDFIHSLNMCVVLSWEHDKLLVVNCCSRKKCSHFKNCNVRRARWNLSRCF